MIKKIKTKLNFHLITSENFWVGAPMLISEIIRRGHYISVFDEKSIPPIKILIDCDVLIDMSTITKKSFYFSLNRTVKFIELSGRKAPLMIDPPLAAINSFDKHLTHKLFPDLIPKSDILTGKNNFKKIKKFEGDKFIVVKPKQGWCGIGVKKMTFKQVLNKYIYTKDIIIQEYIPPTGGIGRIVTFFHSNDFEIAVSYTRITTSWRTGNDVSYICKKKPVTKKLRKFALEVSQKCGLYLNGIDYIYHNGKYKLLEVNAVPAMKEPLIEFGIDIPKKLLDHIERNIS